MAHFSVLFIALLLWLFLAVNAEIPGVYTRRPLENAPAIIYAASGTMDAKSHRIEPELKKQIAIGRPHSAETETNPTEHRQDGFWQVGTQAGTYIYHEGAASSSPIPAANPHSHSWTSFKLHVMENGESEAQPPLSKTTDQSSPPIPAAEPPCTWTALRPFKHCEMKRGSKLEASPPLSSENKSLQSSNDKALSNAIYKLLIALPFLITAVVGIIYTIFTRRGVPNIGAGPEVEMPQIV